MTQCLGRLVKDGKGMLSFESGGLFHLPLRCEMATRSGDLCDSCAAKEAKTIEKLKGIRGTTIGGPLPSYLMGRVTDPIPYWSRLYDGAWFRLKLESGCRVTEEDMQKVRKAVAKAYEGVTQVGPEEMPGGVRKVAELKAVPKPAEPVPKPVKAVTKPVKPQSGPQAEITGAVDLSDDTIVHIKVRKQEVDGRMFYLDPKKDKLYDMKFNYVGRYKNSMVVAHPDSDAEV